MKLENNEIGLWFYLQGGKNRPQKLPEEIFSRQEQQRYHTIISPGKRKEFLCSRLLLKKILDHYLPTQAAEIFTKKDGFGRPFWYSRQGKIPLYFSLSHTRGIIACAVAHIPEIGCDIELIRQRKYETKLAAKVLGKKELSFYREQTDTSFARHFFYKCWTLKEAYLKAKGIGIRESLAALDFGCNVQPNSFSLFAPQGQESWQCYHHFFPGKFSFALTIKSDSKITIQRNIYNQA